MSKTRSKSKQRRSGLQKPLNPGMSEQEAAAILASPAQHSGLELFRALAARGLCEMYGSPDNPTIRLSPAFRNFRPEQAGEQADD